MDGNNSKFKDLHFVEEDEGPEIVRWIVKDRNMLKFLKFFDISVDMRTYFERLQSIRTVTELQQRVMVPVFEQIFDKTTEGVFCSDVEIIPRDKALVFLSNHRDIILDAGAMNMMLFRQGIRFGNAAIGDNLLMNDPVKIVFHIMKSFVIKRALLGKERVQFLIQLSEFINYAVREREESIWLAQGAGRAKDGNDQTNPAVLKMLSMAGRKDPVAHLKSLNLHTSACSYEWDPCDVYKVKELLAQAEGVAYVKEKNEDMLSIQTGICGYKGGIHVAFNRVASEELDACIEMNERERYGYLAELIDSKILAGYKLWATNYIAADLLNDSADHAEHYTDAEKEAFVLRMNDRLTFDAQRMPLARELFLKGYANPVFNKKAGRILSQ